MLKSEMLKIESFHAKNVKAGGLTIAKMFFPVKKTFVPESFQENSLSFVKCFVFLSARTVLSNGLLFHRRFFYQI